MLRASDITASTPRSHNYFAVIIVVLLILTATGLILSFWPGIVTWDALTQYDQASGDYLEDWHPPIMAWIWRQFIPIRPGPAPMLLLQLLLYGAGYALAAGWALSRKRYGLAIALAAGALMPLTVGLMGSVLKDCLMLGVLMLATGLFLWSENHRRWPTRAIAILALLFAATLRFNAFLAAFPIATALMPDAFRRSRARLVATATTTALALILVMPLENRALSAEPSGVELSLIIFDLGGITEHSGVNVFPPLPIRDVVAANHQCYSPVKWDYYSPWSRKPCAITFDGVRASFSGHGEHAFSFWARAIAEHPLAYLAHRLGHFNINTSFLMPTAQESPVAVQSTPNVWNFSVQPNRAQELVEAAASIGVNTPLGWPACWLALALSTLMVGYRLPSKGLIVPIASSALLYGLGYAVLSVSSEFRYHLWTAAGTMIAATIAIDDICNGTTIRRAQFYYAATPLVVVVTLAMISRIIPA